MNNYKTKLLIRKSHRYLGIIIGIQLLFWTISGLYFTWSDLDQIHGDDFKQIPPPQIPFQNLINPGELNIEEGIFSLELKSINKQAFYWINNNQLYNAYNGSLKSEITEEEALAVAKHHLINELPPLKIEYIKSTDKHHEYRNRKLPAYVITFDHPHKIKAYVSAKDGSFQTVRHRNWRYFDFLWMVHTMDYKGRDNFNNFLIRAMALLAIITVASGFVLWISSSRRSLLPKK